MTTSNPLGSPAMSPSIVRRYHVLSVAIFVVGFSLTALAFVFSRNQQQLIVKEDFVKAAKTHVSAVSQGFAQNIQLVRAVEAYFAATGYVSRDSFRAFAQPLLARYPGMKALEWLPRATAENRDKFEKAAQRDFPGFRIIDRLKDGTMIPAKSRPEYVPVYYVEPYEGNEKALGFDDLGADPARSETLGRARDTGNIVASPRIVLVQEKTEQFGILVFDPLYRSAHPTTLEERQADLLGFVLGVFRIGDMVETSLSPFGQLGVDLTIYDESADPSERYLYTHLSRTRSSLPASARDQPNLATDLTYAEDLDISGRTWSIKVTPAPGYYDTSTGVYAWAVFLAGFALTLAVAVYAQVLRLHTRALALSESAEHERAEQAEELASRDGLTKLYNHRMYYSLLKDEILRAQRYNRPVSVLMLDIDHFKRVNDTYGHQAGDAMLKAVCDLLVRQARTIDRVCRYGGDEITVILPETDETAAMNTAERLRAAVERHPFDIGGGNTASIAVSIGVATFPQRVNSLEGLVKAADLALYAAKEGGRNRICRYEPELATEKTSV